MITWYPHTEAPIGESVVAVIAATAPADGHRYIMPEQYRYSATESMWIGERTGLPLKPAEFAWATTTDVLVTHTIPHARAEEIDALKSTVISLLGILRLWEPDHASAEERRQIVQAMYQVGILTDPTKTAEAMKVGAGETAEVKS